MVGGWKSHHINEEGGREDREITCEEAKEIVASAR
jgi:hypothetical protein